MSIEARQIQKTLYSYAAILNFTPSPQGLRAKFGACSVQNAQLLVLSSSLTWVGTFEVFVLAHVMPRMFGRHVVSKERGVRLFRIVLQKPDFYT